jgi:hypothetical protein
MKHLYEIEGPMLALAAASATSRVVLRRGRR